MGYPKVRTIPSDEVRLHNIIVVEYAPGKVSEEYCGDHWCSGRCGLKSLVVPAVEPVVGQCDNERRELKCGGNQVACGAVAQRWRVKWQGEVDVVPEQYRKTMIKMMYW